MTEREAMEIIREHMVCDYCPQGCNKCNISKCEDRDALDIVESVVKKQMNNGWIPCSERLPEESLNSVLGWDSYRNRCVFVQFWNGEFVLGNHESVNIIAWMPFPEPYKEGEEE